MGIGDFLKKTVDSATKKVQEVSKAAAEAGKEIVERQRLQKHMELYEEERKKRREEVEYYRKKSPSCEKGDCSLCYENFFYTCPENCACERKDAVDENHRFMLTRPEYMPYIKWMGANFDFDIGMLELKGIDVSFEAILDYEYLIPREFHVPPHDRLPGKFADGIVTAIKYYEVPMAFIENELPDYSNSAYYLSAFASFAFSLTFNGFGEKNKLLQFLIRAHERKLDINLCPERFLQNLGKSIFPFNEKEEGPAEIYLDIDRDIYYNPSLYQRTEQEFVITVLAIETVLDPDYFKILYPDLPYEPEKIMEVILDENGQVKPTGLNGQDPEADTLWNTLAAVWFYAKTMGLTE